MLHTDNVLQIYLIRNCKSLKGFWTCVGISELCEDAVNKMVRPSVTIQLFLINKTSLPLHSPERWKPCHSLEADGPVKRAKYWLRFFSAQKWGAPFVEKLPQNTAGNASSRPIWFWFLNRPGGVFRAGFCFRCVLWLCLFSRSQNLPDKLEAGKIRMKILN